MVPHFFIPRMVQRFSAIASKPISRLVGTSVPTLATLPVCVLSGRTQANPASTCDRYRCGNRNPVSVRSCPGAGSLSVNTSLEALMRVVFQQVDMDTALTAWLLGVQDSDELVHVHNRADARDLLSAGVLCIECGGSGQTQLLNFDHHDTLLGLPPACRQAFDWVSCHTTAPQELARRIVSINKHVRCLVGYVATIDEFGPQRLPSLSGFPKLSQLFSGMRLSIPGPTDQLHAGISLFSTITQQGLDPAGILPPLRQWQPWLLRRQHESEMLLQDLNRLQYHRTNRGYLVGYLQSDRIGAMGAIYKLGCELAVANRTVENDGRQHYRIGSNRFQLRQLLDYLQTLELGWGGPSRLTIIGSPREGSTISPTDLIDITRRNC